MHRIINIALSLCLVASVVTAQHHVEKTGPAPPTGKTRTYYVAADEVLWNYAPAEKNLITGQPYGEVENNWVKSGPDRIGRVYRKSVYREYTDSKFTTLKPRPPAWEHLGMLGPLLRGQVGDTLRVVFKNNTRYPATMHPHGLSYTKSSEGAPSADGTGPAEKGDDSVPPGGTYTYVWPIPERAGPAHGDPDSILWMYHSHVNEDKDVNAGLLGPILVNRRGSTKPDGTPNDVDREFIVAFFEVDENVSWYLDENVQNYTEPHLKITPDMLVFTHPFGFSNLKESLNGFLYGNLPSPTMRVGERVRWYLMAGTDFEIHAPHWHGNTVVMNHMRTDVVSLTTMGMVVADMIPDNPGKWLFHCHVKDHLNAGMMAHYIVQP